MIFAVIARIAITLLFLGVLLAFIRLLRGPSVPDRIIALDLMTTIGIGIAAVYAIAENQPVVLDVAGVLAMIAFLGTIAFAYYIERRAKGL